VAYAKQGAYAQARADFHEAMRLTPALPNSYKNLAWLLATCPQVEFRDGVQAVSHAHKALQLAGQQVAEWVGILAAAHAEARDYEEAIKWQTECLDQSPPKLKSAMESRLVMYKEGRPYRETHVAKQRTVEQDQYFVRVAHNVMSQPRR
jgi:tetratricopeptide (TPR) repeat protein